MGAPEQPTMNRYRPTVSVIVVSRGRPVELSLCLRGLSQVQYDPFEIIVVADSAGVDAVHAEGLEDRIKVASCEEANISVARNIGLSLAAGEIVAFIDDDAVPEPTWLAYLVAPFLHGTVAATGGYVRGRNGISFQWKAESIDNAAVSRPLRMRGDAPMLFAPVASRAIKTQGTNCAFRREVFEQLGGFDEAYRFYLDESDINMRIARAGGETVIVPLAQVHHGYAASDQRSRNRAPRDLRLIGESLAVYHQKYLSRFDVDAAWTDEKAAQRKRLISFMLRGLLLPSDVGPLMRGLTEGYEHGRTKPHGNITLLGAPSAVFQRFVTAMVFEAPHYISGRVWSEKTLHARARRRVADGVITTLFVFSPSSFFHNVRFHPDGYWVQRGGIWGKSIREGRVVKRVSFNKRVKQEVARNRLVRGFA